jgi:hypothetical protein
VVGVVKVDQSFGGVSGFIRNPEWNYRDYGPDRQRRAALTIPAAIIREPSRLSATRLLTIDRAYATIRASMTSSKPTP